MYINLWALEIFSEYDCCKRKHFISGRSLRGEYFCHIGPLYFTLTPRKKRYDTCDSHLCRGSYLARPHEQNPDDHRKA